MLTEFCHGNTQGIANTLFQLHEKWLYTWTSPDSQCQNQIDHILWSWRWRRFIQSARTRMGADYGSDYELLPAKIRLKLKKVGEVTRPFRYNLNQIPYDYKVEVTNRFKGLDLIDRVPEEIWTEVHNIVKETMIKPSQEKEMQKCKMVVWGGLTNSWEKKRSKGKGEKKKKYIYVWMQSSKE